MTDFLKPLPAPDPVTTPFWDSLKAGAMKVQCCDACGKFIFYPRALCSHCFSRKLTWTPVSGRGTIYTLTVVEKTGNTAFKGETPYVVALVELEEGFRMMTNIVGVAADPEAVKIGMPVEIVYDAVTPEITLPKFRPTS